MNYGTNEDDFVHSGTAPSIDQSTPPSWDTGPQLVSASSYNVRGLVEVSIDPENQRTKTIYDDLDRRIATIENFVDGDVSWSAGLGRWVASGLNVGEPDTDRTTSFVYDGNHNVAKQVAHLPAAGGEEAQVTEYLYGVDTDTSGNPLASEIHSADLLGSVVYPDGEPVFYAYNLQGELTAMEDQNGTDHQYQRDLLGRVTQDIVTDFGQDIDTAIEAIETTYDDAGRVSLVTSYSDYATTTVANEVEFTYTLLWQIKEIWQEPDGAVDRDGMGNDDSQKVTYDYTEADIDSGNHSRVLSIEYPDGAALAYGYGTAGSSDDRISRLRSYEFDGTDIVEYSRIGLDMLAIVDLLEPMVQLDRTASHTGERQYDTYEDSPGLYPGYDRFGRVARQMWVDFDFETHDPSQGPDPDEDEARIPPAVELTYTYDRASNRETAYNENPVLEMWSNKDFQYVYDGLDRLTEAKRGVAGAPWTYAPGSPNYTASQQWALDAVGNWDSVWRDADADAEYETTERENREHNDVNELTERDTDADDTADLSLTFDKNGNLRTEEIGAGPTTITYTHDAWNRLVKVMYADDDRGEYEYNGLNWRIVKRSDSNLLDEVDQLDQERVMYYSANWQLLEEGVDDGYGGTADPRRVQYVWGDRYIDDIILRREDAGDNGSYNKTFYHLTDAQFSTVAILEGAKVIERASYDAYGNARHHRPGDLDGDGLTNNVDFLALLGNWGFFGRGDIDRSGTVDTPDLLVVLSEMTDPALPAGQLSLDSVDNQIGYDGYVFNAETQHYHVRFRCYDPVLGRWLERDPFGMRPVPRIGESFASDGAVMRSMLGDSHGAPGNDALAHAFWPELQYADGMSLYQYVKGQPIIAVDPSGELGVAKAVIAGLAVAVIACGKPQHDAAHNRYPDSSDKFKHCWVSCRMSKTCGGVITELAGLGKEGMDAIKRIIGIRAGGTGTWADSVDDLIANQQCVGLESFAGPLGGWIGAIFRQSCEDCCRQEVGYNRCRD